MSSQNTDNNLHSDGQMPLAFSPWDFSMDGPFDDDLSKEGRSSPSPFDDYLDAYSEYDNTLPDHIQSVKDLDIASNEYEYETTTHTENSPLTHKASNYDTNLESEVSSYNRNNERISQHQSSSKKLNMDGQPSFGVSEDMQNITVSVSTVAKYSGILQKEADSYEDLTVYLDDDESDSDSSKSQNNNKQTILDYEPVPPSTPSKPKNASALFRASRSNSVVSQAPLSPSKGAAGLSPAKITKLTQTPSKHRKNRHGGSTSAVALALQSSGAISSEIYLSSNAMSSPSHHQSFTIPPSPLAAPSPLGDPNSQLQSIQNSPVRPQSIQKYQQQNILSPSGGAAENLKQKLFEVKDAARRHVLGSGSPNQKPFSPPNLDPFDSTPEIASVPQFSNSVTPNLGSNSTFPNMSLGSHCASGSIVTSTNLLHTPVNTPASPTKPQRTPKVPEMKTFTNSPQINGTLMPTPQMSTATTTMAIPMTIPMAMAPPPIPVPANMMPLKYPSNQNMAVPYAITPQQPLGPPPIERRQQFLQKEKQSGKSDGKDCEQSKKSDSLDSTKSKAKSSSPEKKISEVLQNKNTDGPPVHLTGPPASYLTQQPPQQMAASMTDAVPMITGGYTMEQLGALSVQNPAYFEQLKQANPMIAQMINGILPTTSVYPMTNYPPEIYQQMQPGMPFYPVAMNLMPNGQPMGPDPNRSLAWQPVVTAPVNDEAQDIIRVQQERQQPAPVVHPSNRKSCLPPGKVDEYITGPDENGQFLCLYANCGKLFKKRYNARSHIQTHLCDRPYVCEVCSATFVRPHDLRRHEMSHKEEKPFACPCGKTFTRHDALQRHRIRMICEGGIEIPGKPKKPPGKRGRPKKKVEGEEIEDKENTPVLPDTDSSSGSSQKSDKRTVSSDEDYDTDSQSSAPSSNASPSKSNNLSSSRKGSGLPATGIFRPFQVESSPSLGMANPVLAPQQSSNNNNNHKQPLTSSLSSPSSSSNTNHYVLSPNMMMGQTQQLYYPQQQQQQQQPIIYNDFLQQPQIPSSSSQEFMLGGNPATHAMTQHGMYGLQSLSSSSSSNSTGGQRLQNVLGPSVNKNVPFQMMSSMSIQ